MDGVRVFESNGAMLHAKTAVADGKWARVGSTNLNIASWFGNCELDAVIEDERFAHEMEEMYLQDLGIISEVVLNPKQKAHAPGEPLHPQPAFSDQRRRQRWASGCRSSSNEQRYRCGFYESPATGANRSGLIMITAGTLLLTAAILFAFFPRLLVYPVVVFLGWAAAALLFRGYRLHGTLEMLEKVKKE